MPVPLHLLHGGELPRQAAALALTQSIVAEGRHRARVRYGIRSFSSV